MVPHGSVVVSLGTPRNADKERRLQVFEMFSQRVGQKLVKFEISCDLDLQVHETRKIVQTPSLQDGLQWFLLPVFTPVCGPLPC